MRYPAVMPAVLLAVGIGAGIFLPVPVALTKFTLVLSFLNAVLAFALRRDHAATLSAGLGFVLAGALLGLQADSTARSTPLGALFAEHVGSDGHQVFAVIEGRLRADAARGPSGASLSLDVDRLDVNGASHATSGGVLLGVAGALGGDQILQWRGGRRVRIPATLRKPVRYLNPGVPDSHRQYARRGTTLVGSVKSEWLVEVQKPGDLLSETTAAIRAAARGAVASSVAPWSERSAAVVLAILIGDRAGLDDEVERKLQEAGTYHVIAISGGNIAILAGFCILLLHAAGAGARLSALMVIVLLSGYAMVVEGGPSVWRATLMAAIYFGAQFWDQRSLPANVAALTAAVLFALQPLQVVDAGFALTFGATIGIIIGMSRLHRLAALAPWSQPAVALLAASICAEVALLPVGAVVFSRVTAAGLLANFAAIPLMTVVQIAGMFAAAFTAVGFAAAGLWAGRIAHWAVQGLIDSAALVDIMPWLTRRVPPPSIYLVAVYYAVVIAAVLTGRRACAAIAVACAFLIVIAPQPDLRKGPEPLRVTFLDVGQGDAALVQFPNGRSLSIDAGGAPNSGFDIGGRVVSPALWASGIRRLDYMTISHSDPDHIGGAASVLRDFSPFEVWEGVPVPPNNATQQLRALGESAGISWRTLVPADRISFGAVELRVHHPPPPEWERQRVRNDDSEVLEIRYGGVSFVFTGDIGREVEREIAPAFGRIPIRILKVPHHGSATSSSREFLDALRPAIAVISAGRGNPFGHPVPAVVQRYRDVGVAIYRTDQDGAVTVETDGHTVRVRTFTNRRLTLRTSGR